MLRKDWLLEVWRHKNIGYIPNFYLDYNFAKPGFLNDRPEGKDGYDWFGVHWTYQPDINAPAATPGYVVIDDITKWREQLKIPDLDQYDWEAGVAAETASWDRENKISMVMLGNGIFERSHLLMGFEEALASMLEEPEEFSAMMSALADHRCELIRKVAKYYKPDIIMMHDDYGTGSTMMMSPNTWRELLKEPLARQVKTAHECGMIYEHHSCGFIEPIIGDLIEIGVDALNPLQPCNNLALVKEKYGKQLTLVGGFDSQHVTDKPDATPDEIRANIHETFDALAPGGGYVCFGLSPNKAFAPILIEEHKKLATKYAD